MIQLTLSKNHNPNYIAKVVALRNLRKHSNADKLQCTMIDGNNTIVGIEQKDGDLGVFFPAESRISLAFLKKNNLLREKDHNADKTKAGFFELNGRVKCIKLRGEKSEGFWMPIEAFEERPNIEDWQDAADAGLYFDTVDGELLVKKYVIAKSNQRSESKAISRPTGIKALLPRIKRFFGGGKKKDILVEGQFNFHKDTSMLGRNIHRLQPDQYWSITRKMHGTSCISSKVLAKRDLSWTEKLAKFCGVKVVETEYKNLYSSRRVIKNLGPNLGSYYSEDIWGAANQIVEPCLKDGMTVYYEIVGHLTNGSHIQKNYDYGCDPGKFEIYVYRITFTSPSGAVFEWSSKQIKAWCQNVGLKFAPELWCGHATNYLSPEALESRGFDGKDLDKWREIIFLDLQKTYLEKWCPMSRNKVPDEGIVFRIDDSMEFEVFKLKSFLFREWESKALDKGEADIEAEQDEALGE